MSNSTQPRYLKQVEVWNFQSYKHVKVDLKPGFTIVSGTGHVGKSALLRAINFAMHNDPSRGTFFVRQQTPNQPAKVKLTFSDDISVIREKGTTVNQATIVIPGQPEKRFDKIGDKLPEEVVAALGYPPSDEFHGPLTYVEQFAPPFFVSLSETQLPRAIAGVIGVSAYEDAAKELLSEVNKGKKDLTSLDKQLSNIEQNMKDLGDLDQLKSQAEYFEVFNSQYAKLENIIANSNNVLQTAKQLLQKSKQTQHQISVANDIISIKPQTQDLMTSYNSLKAAHTHLNNAKKLKNQMRIWQQQAKYSQRVVDSVTSKHIQQMTKLHKDIQSSKDIITKYKQCQLKLTNSDNAIASAQTTIAENVQKIKHMKQNLKGAICPTCQQEIRYA